MFLPMPPAIDVDEVPTLPKPPGPHPDQCQWRRSAAARARSNHVPTVIISGEINEDGSHDGPQRAICTEASRPCTTERGGGVGSLPCQDFIQVFRNSKIPCGGGDEMWSIERGGFGGMAKGTAVSDVWCGAQVCWGQEYDACTQGQGEEASQRGNQHSTVPRHSAPPGCIRPAPFCTAGRKISVPPSADVKALYPGPARGGCSRGR